MKWFVYSSEKHYSSVNKYIVVVDFKQKISELFFNVNELDYIDKWRR